MEKILILTVAISVLGGVNSLQCYQCTNCTEVNSEQLVTCGANTTVTTTTTTQTPSTTTAPNTTITTVSTTTTVTTSTPVTTTTNATTTTPSNTTTNGTTTTTTVTPSTTTVTPSTTTVTPSTTLPSNDTTNSTANATQENPETFRVRRSAEVQDNCLCNYNGECNCHGLQIIQFGDVKATESYVCVKDTLNVNGATVINRGCAVKHNETQETCVSSAFSSNCTVCETDQCNNAASFNFSILVLVISFFAAVKLV